MSELYENVSIILTSNKSFTEWVDIFSESVIATAILDGLLLQQTWTSLCQITV
ncbi:MAG: ATP-binding protein [Dehalobacterium sp.]